MAHIPRYLDINLPERQSAFLWGPRKTGKTTLLREKFPESLYFDFLQTDLFLEFSRRPYLLRQRLLAQPEKLLAMPIVLDEVQKIPAVLDEVQWLIDNRGLRFVLCGSSARKLKRGKANLLGGRAWRYELFPLVSAELPDMNLLEILNRGLIPAHYFSVNYRKSLQGYIQDYLKEEVFAEGLIRNIPAFSRFFEAMAHSHGELVNFTNIARECGVDAKTVREHYQILCDTFLGRFVSPFKRRQDRQVITRTPKFYLFDVGVAGGIINRHLSVERGELFGKAFEHFIFMELVAHASYSDLNYNINFWRTKSGLEVDFVLGDGEIAVEVKGKSYVDRTELRGIRAFAEEHHPRESIVVCNESAPRLVEGIRVLPWREFLVALWHGEIMR